MACGANNWRVDQIGNAWKIEGVHNSQWMLECGHVFHKDCIDTNNGQHIQKCPLYRETRPANELYWSGV
jgi:hypothetical protein